MINRLLLAGAALLTLPAILFKVGGLASAPQWDPLIFGAAIVGAAFLLTWASEVAEMDISKSLALALLALIAVLPEYSVDLYFAWTAGKDPAYAHYAVANMTGANRLLIGFGWVLVVFLFWFRTKRTALVLDRSHKVEFLFLGLATLYAFTIPLKGSLNLIDAAVLLALFGAYFLFASRARVVEPELVGPSRIIGSLPKTQRRVATVLIFVFSAVVIFISAKPFAEGLLHIGATYGVDEFLLVQWVAPLASEAPEIIVACIFALRGNAAASIGVLVSSKVNQWTLLVGALPIAYSISSGTTGGLALDSRQIEEIFLTAAQSAFAIVLLARLRFSLLSGGALFLLFGTQLLFVDPAVRYGYAVAYLALCAIILLVDRTRFKGLMGMAPSVIRQFKASSKRG